MKLNINFDEFKIQLQNAMIGLHTMSNEHQRIGLLNIVIRLFNISMKFKIIDSIKTKKKNFSIILSMTIHSVFIENIIIID